MIRYHAWTYELDGTLRKAPKFEDGVVSGFEKNTNSLFPVKVHCYLGLVFINMNPEAEPFEKSFGQFQSRLPKGYDLENGYEYHSTFRYEIACNWKTFLDGFNECYHCRAIHPLFDREYDLPRYLIQPFDNVLHHYCPRKQTSEPALGSLEGAWFFLYPSLGFEIYETYWNTIQVLPLSATKTALVVTYYGKKGLAKETLSKYIKDVSEQTFNEDIPACETVQKNLEAGIYNTGPLHPLYENGVIFFGSRIRKALENQTASSSADACKTLDCKTLSHSLQW